MSDFVTRLEAELIRAAEREQGGTVGRFLGLLPRVRPGAALAAAALACAALVATIVALPHGSRPSPPARVGPVPGRMIGDYERTVGAGRIALILDTRRYTLLIPGAGSVVGDAAVHGGVLVLGNDGTGACRPTTGIALYRAHLDGPRLRLTPISDRCRSRARALASTTLRRTR